MTAIGQIFGNANGLLAAGPLTIFPGRWLQKRAMPVEVQGDISGQRPI